MLTFHPLFTSHRLFQELIIEDVRCFAGRNRLQIRPITLLVGENSTGKSTVLGCIQALASASATLGAVTADFNLAPFNMGVFADIVRKSRPLKKSFKLGYSCAFLPNRSFETVLCFSEGKDRAEPITTGVQYDFSDGGTIHFVLSRNSEGKSPYTIKKKAPNKFSVNCPNNLVMYDSEPYERSEHYDEFMKFFRNKSKECGFASSYSSLVVESFSPIRSVPRRTYDPVRITGAADGSDAPQKLRNMSKKEFDALAEKLVSFGEASGMFDKIQIRQLGRAANDPFQMQLKVRNGPSVPLVDVGYGVSQIIPILVQILTSRVTRTSHFLLQQPEVHLHPKAQAELASLLVHFSSSGNWRRKPCFILETHSDQIIDRVRIEIMNGKIKADDVSLIYLHPVRNRVQVHNISFDAQANMIGVPQGYRDFFGKETDRLLGFQ